MSHFSQCDQNYNKQIRSYTQKDGLLSIGCYLVYLATVFLQGYLYLTNVNSTVLNFSQAGFAVIGIIIAVLFMKATKSTLYSIGINRENLKKTLLYGIAGSILLRLFIVLFDGILKGNFPIIQSASAALVITFAIGALSEEFVFRGFIQTRLQGLLKNYFAASCLNALLFVSIHYPVRWVVTGSIDFTALTGFYVICLVLLHFFCDFVYKKTNCLWGAVLLHILYNISGAIIILN